VHVLGDLAPEALALQFARASIYALPARYEPFGLSVLEAALAGCALVLGDIPSLREVWGDTALYVAPDDERALRECLARLISEPAAREDYAHAARLRALEFTPERHARGYLCAYATICDSGRTAIPRRSAVPVGRRACVS
jgi:glycosyltransferase involved in cell wall biosynthesis